MERIIMSNSSQNLAVLMEPSDDPSRIDLKVGNMYLNRFCIHEDAAFELSTVGYLEKSVENLLTIEKPSKGKGESSSLKRFRFFILCI